MTAATVVTATTMSGDVVAEADAVLTRSCGNKTNQKGGSNWQGKQQEVAAVATNCSTNNTKQKGQKLK